MNQNDLDKVREYFYLYSMDCFNVHEIKRLFFCHKKYINFKILITDGKVYQLNSEYNPQGIELQTFDDLKIRFRSFVGGVVENVEENNDIDSDEELITNDQNKIIYYELR